MASPTNSIKRSITPRILNAKKDGKEKVESRFIKEVRNILLKKSQKELIVNPKKSGNPHTIYDVDNLIVGLAIIHTKFGEGHIVRIESDRVILQFGEIQKTLAIEMLLVKGYLAKNMTSVPLVPIVK